MKLHRYLSIPYTNFNPHLLDHFCIEIFHFQKIEWTLHYILYFFLPTTYILVWRYIVIGNSQASLKLGSRGFPVRFCNTVKEGKWTQAITFLWSCASEPYPLLSFLLFRHSECHLASIENCTVGSSQNGTIFLARKYLLLARSIH